MQTNTSFALLDGWPVSELSLHLPSSGVFRAYAEVLVDTGEVITGTVPFTIGDQTFTMTVFKGGSSLSLWKGRLVGGSGGQAIVLAPKYYKGATALLCFTDALREAGYTLALDSDTTVLNKLLPSWTRTGKPFGSELNALTAQVGTQWRMLKDGTVWTGIDSEKKVTVDYLELDFFPETSKLWIIPTSLDIFPGMLLAGRVIEAVTHRLLPDRFYTEVTFRAE